MQGMELRPARIGLGMMAAIALAAVGLTPPAAAQGIDAGAVGGMLGGLFQRQAAPKPATPSASPAPVSQFGQPAARAAAPAGPVALVEEVSGVSGIEVMDGLTEGQTKQLGKGRLVLSHVDGCLVERISGGTVTVHAGGSQVVGGRLDATRTPGCSAPRAVASLDAREAGGTVSRITPFQSPAWQDIVIKGPRPIFTWSDKSAGQVTISLVDVAPPRPVWSGRGDAGRLAYPASAPALDPGSRYLVEIAGRQRVAALFSLDPGLDVADGLAAQLVRVDRTDLSSSSVAASTQPLAR